MTAAEESVGLRRVKFVRLNDAVPKSRRKMGAQVEIQMRAQVETRTSS